MEVVNVFELSNSSFMGTVQFLGDSRFGSLSINNTIFNNPDVTISFDQMKVVNSFELSNSNFMGKTDFSGIHVGHNFTCVKTNFKHPKTAINFFNMCVDNYLLFNEVNFNGSVSGFGMTIKSQFLLSNTTFSDPNGIVDFAHSAIGDSIGIVNSKFQGFVSFQSSNVNRNFIVSNSVFESHQKEFDLQGMKVGGYLNLSGATFNGPINLSGLKYGKIINNSLEGLIELANEAVYSADVYLTLEDFFEKQGDFKRADQIYANLKRRQRKEFLSGFSKATSVFFDYTVLFGRKPQRTLYVTFFFIILGSFVFRHKVMTTRNNDSNNSIKFFSLWYSIDLFLPFVNMHWANDWMPKAEHRLIRFWTVVHTLAGWLLIPLGLAAWMGIIK